MTYRIEEMPCSSETPLSERKWKVTYTPPLGSSADPSASATAVHASATDEEHARHYNQQSDNGLAEDAEYICHICSLRDCSCQLPSSLKLPCRHQVGAAHIVCTTGRVTLTYAREFRHLADVAQGREHGHGQGRRATRAHGDGGASPEWALRTRADSSHDAR